MLALQPTMGFSLLGDFLPFRPFLTQFEFRLGNLFFLLIHLKSEKQLVQNQPLLHCFRSRIANQKGFWMSQ